MSGRGETSPPRNALNCTRRSARLASLAVPGAGGGDYAGASAAQVGVGPESITALEAAKQAERRALSLAP